MIIDPLKKLPDELYEFIFHLLNNNENWVTIKQLVEVEFNQTFKIDPELENIWVDFYTNVYDNHNNLTKYLHDYKYKLHSTFYKLDLSFLIFLEQQSIRYFIINNIMLNHYEIYFQETLDKNILNKIDVIYYGRNEKIHELNWKCIPIRECKLLLNQIEKENKNNHMFNSSDIERKMRGIIDDWITTNRLIYNSILTDHRVYFENVEHFIMFKLVFV